MTDSQGRAPTTTLGVDPGAVQGAAVLLGDSGKAPHEVLGAWRWKQRASGAYTVLDAGGAVLEFPSLHAVGLHIAAAVAGPYTLTVEGLFIPSLSRGPSVITLAEATGEVVGPLRSGAVGEVRRPNAATWRGKVLRLARASAEAFAARSIQCAPSVGQGMGALAGCEHACDALHIAYWGMVMASRDAGR